MATDSVVAAGIQVEGVVVMRRADRLFDIIQALRGRRGPITARALADVLEVSERTIYRDVATLQARRVPIEGEAGVGYMLRKGYDLPPVMLTDEEAEAIAVGLRLLRRLRDRRLSTAADAVLSKLSAAASESVRDGLQEPRIWVSAGSLQIGRGADLGKLREAIREARKLQVGYTDVRGCDTRRVVRPIAMVYHVDVTLIAAWCELRGDFRHFRIDRIVSCVALDQSFADAAEGLRRDWSRLRGADDRHG